MPWQSSGGGGPWGGGGSGGGSGGGGPWGRPGGSGGGGGYGGGGQRPPDIEDLIRKGQERIKKAMPGGFGSGKSFLLIIAVLVLLWMLSGFYRVQPGEQGVVLTFGEWTNQATIAQPGLHWHLPYPIETAVTPDVETVRQIDVGFRGQFGGNTARPQDVPEESLMLTGDQNIIDIDFSVQWRISDAGQYLFNIRDPEVTVKAAAESAMREIIGRTDIQPALTEARDEIALKTKELLQGILNSYGAGILITEVRLQNVQPPEPVIDAFDEVQRAQQDLDRRRNEADAYRNKVIPEARGEAQRMIQEAAAYKEQIVNEAQGEAQRFLSVYEAYKQNPEVTERRMYLETIQKVFSKTDKVIMDQTNQGAVPYLPLNELRRQSGQGSRSQPSAQNDNQ